MTRSGAIWLFFLWKVHVESIENGFSFEQMKYGSDYMSWQQQCGCTGGKYNLVVLVWVIRTGILACVEGVGLVEQSPDASGEFNVWSGTNAMI